MGAGMYGIGGNGGVSDSISSAKEGAQSANKAVLSTFQELRRFCDSQDQAMKTESEQRLREQVERLAGMLERLGAGQLQGLNMQNLDQLQQGIDQARLTGNDSPALREAQQMLDDLRSRMGQL